MYFTFGNVIQNRFFVSSFFQYIYKSKESYMFFAKEYEIDSDSDVSDEEQYDSAKFADEESYPVDIADCLLVGEFAVWDICVHL